MLKKINLSLILLIFWLILSLNIFLFKNLFIGLFFGLAYLILTTSCLSKIFFKKHSPKKYWLLISITLLCAIIIILSLFYYLIGIYNWTVVLILLLPLIIIFLKKPNPATFCFNQGERQTIKPQNNLTPQPLVKLLVQGKQFNNLAIITIYLILTAVNFLILFRSKTTDPIVSPWAVMPSYFFIFYFMATALLIKIIFQKINTVLKLFLISLHIFLSSSVAIIIYQLGYGFDPFIHQATQKIILSHGFVSPKTPYYIGEYSVVVFLSHLFQISSNLIDKLLVPLAAALLVPTTAFLTFKNFINKNWALLASLFFSLFCLFTFFITVPQHFANLLLIIFCLFYLLNSINNISLKLLILLTVAICLIHPIAGMPAIILISLFLINKLPNKKIWLIVFCTLSCLALPLIFLIASQILPSLSVQTNFSPEPIKQLKNSLDSFESYLPFHSFLHALYLLKKYFIYLLAILSLSGFYLFFKKYKNKTLFFLPITIFVLLINSLLLQFIKFNNIIFYEQSVFAIRLLHAAFFLCLIFAVYSLILFGKKLFQNKNIIALSLILSFLLTTNLYLSYPRYDTLNKNKGYSVSMADIQAVNLIDNLAGSEDYVVLANQSTSAAALNQLGFKKYFVSLAGQQLFFYPIPTSSPLYQIYLNITYQGIKQEFVDQARSLTNTQKIFIVVSSYWTNYKNLIVQGQKTAKSFYNINDQIHIFEF